MISPQVSQMMPYLVGNKVYGGGRSFPTMGPVDKLGYAERDAKMQARRGALLRQMKANNSGKHMSADSLRSLK
jgi:hypothetical protein